MEKELIFQIMADVWDYRGPSSVPSDYPLNMWPRILLIEVAILAGEDVEGLREDAIELNGKPVTQELISSGEDIVESLTNDWLWWSEEQRQQRLLDDKIEEALCAE